MNTDAINEIRKAVDPEQAYRTVVRLKTEYYSTERGAAMRRTLSTLQRKSTYDLLMEECTMVGADDVIKSIVNFHDVSDGVYELVTCNHSRDWETGIVDDYDFKLIPYKEATK